MCREVSPVRIAENAPGILPLETISPVAILVFFLITAPLALRFPFNGTTEHVNYAAAVLRDEFVPPPGGHQLGVAELDEGPPIFDSIPPQRPWS